MPQPPAGSSCPTVTTQMACLDAFSHVVECIFLLQQDNVICQVLLDSWGASHNLCTFYVLLTVPLDTLTIHYGGTSSVSPLSNAYKNWITQFWDMYAICDSQPAWSDHNIFDLTSSHFDGYCMLLTYHHEWSPPVLSFHHPSSCSCMSLSPSDFT
jgi:hypothetical protein